MEKIIGRREEDKIGEDVGENCLFLTMDRMHVSVCYINCSFANGRYDECLKAVDLAVMTTDSPVKEIS